MRTGNNKRLAFYLEMLRIRVIEEELVRYYAEQEMRCPVHFCIGQEAVPVGVCQALGGADTIMSNHRSHGHYLARGGDLRRMVAELYGRETGCASGKGGSMHLIDRSVNFLGATSIVADTIPIAVGVAFANKLRRRKSVSVVFFGDGATEEGLFYESLNFAALHRLPVFFVCENNLYSVYSPLNVRQPASRNIYKVARSLGVESSRVNGNDVEAVNRASASALRGIRRGRGPYLLEAMTYRYLEHCGPNCDIELGYRAKEELEQWKKADPVAAYERKLIRESVISKDYALKARNRIIKEVGEAVRYAKSSAYPEADRLMMDVYAQ
ncbi:MAG: thiamine pyrophosphate-dependent dehydrogenase E1 component subunit alpha [Thermodesulfovibrionales bacterium]|nr:thiamine pyrophosphate-dependent dehydrogenase E1 component subunit alpha [Thermodesulfovibrionales bacterium]